MKRALSRFKAAAIFIFLFSAIGISAFSDSVELKRGGMIKGIIVEEYNDRIVISTYEGEKTIPKKEISALNFDLPEQNLAKLGDNAMAKREYEKAYFYYSKANKTNPDYVYARDKMNYILGYLFRKQEEEKLRNVQRMQELEGRPEGREKPSREKELKEKFGLVIEEKNGSIAVERVTKNSPAYYAGLRPGDRLVSVWGRLTGYMSPDEISRLLLDESPGEIKFDFERTVVLEKSGRPEDYASVIGGKLEMLFDGLTVAELSEEGRGYAAGLRKNDLIVSIDGAETRYMPMNDVIKKIEDASYKKVRFDIRRNAAMWRG